MFKVGDVIRLRTLDEYRNSVLSKTRAQEYLLGRYGNMTFVVREVDGTCVKIGVGHKWYHKGRFVLAENQHFDLRGLEDLINV